MWEMIIIVMFEARGGASRVRMIGAGASHVRMIGRLRHGVDRTRRRQNVGHSRLFRRELHIIHVGATLVLARRAGPKRERVVGDVCVTETLAHRIPRFIRRVRGRCLTYYEKHAYA